MKKQTRRSFYTSLINALGSLISAALAILAGAYLLLSPKSSGKSNFIEAADLTELQIGKPKEVTFERIRVDGWRTFREKVIAWVVRPDEKSVVAYSPQCTHLGCAYHWEDQQGKFICPCHASAFSLDGKVLEGPADRPLDRYVVQIKNSKLLIGSQIEKA
jgi:menaquinol-cytochrome c reductase iron-sulfur subunit